MVRTRCILLDDDEVHFELDQHAELDFYSASSLKQQSDDRQTCRSTRTHCPDSEPTCICSYSFVLCIFGRKI
jgi:hypothetical protein